jgi:hypothetical protein
MPFGELIVRIVVISSDLARLAKARTRAATMVEASRDRRAVS